MNKIGKRLELIASIVTGKVIADVGCDHGKLAHYLLENKIVDKVIVSDISRPSLQKAIDLLSSKNYNFEYICCDGLVGYIDKSVEECVISGMGGDEIIKIIKSSPITINSYVLSPQHNIIEVKKFMLNNGYNIVFDIIIKDKQKFYNIFKCEKSNLLDNFDEFKLYFGKDNFNNPNSAIEEFVNCEINKIKNIKYNNTIISNEMEDYLKLLNEFNKRK